jgi:hypothetical protein
MTIVWRRWTKLAPSLVEHDLSFDGDGSKQFFKIKLDPELKPDKTAKYY